MTKLKEEKKKEEDKDKFKINLLDPIKEKSPNKSKAVKYGGKTPVNVGKDRKGSILYKPAPSLLSSSPRKLSPRKSDNNTKIPLIKPMGKDKQYIQMKPSNPLSPSKQKGSQKK